MRVEQLQLPLAQKLSHDYVHDFSKVKSFYTYSPYEEASFKKRLDWLAGHPVAHRTQLVEGLRGYNFEIGNDHPRVMENIERLYGNDTYVVIAGQQAGILTGPLYTIYKAMTILQTAKEQEKNLGIPVVPVFWIAGEDHDFDEVNHVYTQIGGEAEKIKLNMEPVDRKSVSHLDVPPETLRNFIETFFNGQIQTEHTAELKRQLFGLAETSPTLTDFFARIMAWFFGNQGLILVDSASGFMRELEKKGFSRVIRYNEEINTCIFQQSERLIGEGYHKQVETTTDNAQFFLYREGKRMGVERLPDGTFQTRDGKERYSPKQLLALLKENPQQFSANVVTRPLMQELIFPTLAFVGGPGEIGYWGMYRNYFELLELELPVILPRATFSLIDRTVQKYMDKYKLTVEDVFFSLAEKKADALKARDTLGIDERFEQVKSEIEHLYKPLMGELTQIEKGLSHLGEKNLKRILDQVSYYERKARESFANRHDVLLRQFGLIENSLFPMDKPQERVYNIFCYLNKYGMDWFTELIGHSYRVNGYHTIVWID
ncbi:bacillithiol biosynthesis cysteine-adding enzyme BshC [Aneurinibacillus terranovensis]|uniref:bacillithiol biosynthesis cysteine-adding enzyme BshC n=1 Tax=Aneurinibacillus terranovensis TaxID=278991 RepID=UPI0003FB0920|nr:bacillithiol biosynthesis cysteine-adding enzyme BshC [Aneurinibacillus terranovensis]